MTTSTLITSDSPQGRDTTAKFRGLYDGMGFTAIPAQCLNESGEFWKGVRSLMAQHLDSSLTLFSDDGDFIGQGKRAIYTSSTTGVFKSRMLGQARNTVMIDVQGSNENWHLEFAAPLERRLRIGAYADAVRFPFHKGGPNPGMSISGCGRGCNRSLAEFTIHQIDYTKTGELRLFSASFVQKDVGFHDPSTYGSLPALRGEIFFNNKNCQPRG